MEVPQILLKSIRSFKYKLYMALILKSLLPTIYRTVRYSLLGSLPDTNAVSIASQMTWISVLLEVVDEGLLLPLYHCFGSAIDTAETCKSEIKNRVKSGLVICSVVYFIFEGSVSVTAPYLVDWMGQQTELQNDTVTYIRIELVAVVLGSLSKFCSQVVIINNWTFGIYTALAIQMIVSITMDVFLLSQLDISLKLGVLGAAWSSVISAVCTLVFLLLYCWNKLGMTLKNDVLGHYNFHWIKVWSRVGVFSALDSLIRNAVYLVVVLRAMNLLNEQDSYWIANGFIWDWLLLPILPLSEVLKQDVATSSMDRIRHWDKICAYLVVTATIVVIWAVTIPAWPLFIANVLNAHNLDLVISLLKYLVPCYTFFNITSLWSAVFYALGRTEILACLAFIGNVLLVSFFLMATYDVIPISVYTIAAIFGGGLVYGCFQTSVAYFVIINRNGGKL